MLSMEKTFELFQMIRLGDRSCRGILIQENLGLVRMIAQKYKGTKIDFLELYNIGVIGLIKAVDTFDVSRNILFVTYASKCIENELFLFFKKNKRWNCYLHFYIPIYHDGNGRELSLEEVLLVDEEDIFVKFDLECTYEEIRYVLGKLSDRDRKVILLYFGFLDDYCYSQEEIASIIHVSQSFVSRIIRRSLVKLKEELLLLDCTYCYSKKLIKTS